MKPLCQKYTPMDRQTIPSIISDIADLIAFDASALIGWREVLAWPVGEARTIRGVLSTKIYQAGNKAKFSVVIPPKVIFDIRAGLTAYCLIEAGVLEDTGAQRVWGAPTSTSFVYGRTHTFRNPSSKLSTKIIVTLNR